MNARKIELTVNCCGQCPFCIEDDGDGESPWQFNKCKKTGNDLNRINGEPPEFCPFPKTEPEID